jgi:hypothetical protein
MSRWKPASDKHLWTVLDWDARLRPREYTAATSDIALVLDSSLFCLFAEPAVDCFK